MLTKELKTEPSVIGFADTRCEDVSLVGGKNASLSRLYRDLTSAGIQTLDGFAITSAAYRTFLSENGIANQLKALFNQGGADLASKAREARNLIMDGELSDQLKKDILLAHARLVGTYGPCAVAVRSSGTAEDLEGSSFAGQHETYLNVWGEHEVLNAVKKCFASLYTDRATDYRSQKGFGQTDVAISVGVQPMIRSDEGCSGVIFTLDPDSGFRDVVVVSGSYGYGEYVVQGIVSPDEWTVFKPKLDIAPNPIVSRRLGSKERMLIAGEDGETEDRTTEQEDRDLFCLTDADVLRLATWAATIEEHFSRRAGRPTPMDLEWAKDGLTGGLYIIQARPETVHALKQTTEAKVFRLTAKPSEPLVVGQAVGARIATGPVRIVRNASSLQEVRDGDVLVAESTDPDWEPVMKRVSAIVTDQGGRTAHAAIVSRELGVACIVGAGNATSTLENGQIVTVSCAEGGEGHVYEGSLDFLASENDLVNSPLTRTKLMMNVADPDKAFVLAQIPNDGVGLARMEFIIASTITAHPMALCHPERLDEETRFRLAELLKGEDPLEFFVRRLAEGIGKIAAAFYPKPVIVRTSDFKTNEYAGLLGGETFEPKEENPMLGFRGASRYYDDRYSEGFELECRALLKARRDMGLDNIKLMIPFCRTPEEGAKVIDKLASRGLQQGRFGLEVYAMCELPSNVVLAEEFLNVFDGYSIGSNDLTQLVLGIDRDSGTVAHLFDERSPAVKAMIADAIDAARRVGKPIGICGQAPSDYPDFARWLVEQGITSISLNPDSLIETRLAVAEAEKQAQPTLAVA